MHISRSTNLPPLIKNPGGEHIQEIIGIQSGSIHSHSLAQVTLTPGKSSAPHFHKESEESYLILSGTASLKIDHVKFKLMPGEAILIEAGEVHQIANTSDENLTFLAVCVPAWQPDDSFDVPQAEA